MLKIRESDILQYLTFQYTLNLYAYVNYKYSFLLIFQILFLHLFNALWQTAEFTVSHIQ